MKTKTELQREHDLVVKERFFEVSILIGCLMPAPSAASWVLELGLKAMCGQRQKSDVWSKAGVTA